MLDNLIFGGGMKELSGKKMPFAGVAAALIVFGAAVFATGLMFWVISFSWGILTISAPFSKVIGGAIIMALGYVVLELELMRTK